MSKNVSFKESMVPFRWHCPCAHFSNLDFAQLQVRNVLNRGGLDLARCCQVLRAS
jgi:hypothetical protein